MCGGPPFPRVKRRSAPRTKGLQGYEVPAFAGTTKGLRLRGNLASKCLEVPVPLCEAP